MFRVSLLLPIVLLSATAAAQPTSGRITGTVTDTTGAGVPGVQLSATEVDTGRSWQTTTDRAGGYTLPILPAGRYSLAATRDGFRSVHADGIRLDVAQVVRQDIVLEVGPLEQRVQVTGNTGVLSTDTTEVGAALDGQTMSALPLNGRNPLSAVLLTPGAVTPNPAAFANGQRTTGEGRPSINGNRKEANNFQLDGVDSNQTTENANAYQPSPDAIQELRVITNNAPAEFGNYQGGIVGITLKSGTDLLHGSLFEYFRNDALNATNWGANWAPPDPLNPRKAPLSHNVFGGAVGAPIVKHRLFVFGDYEGTRRTVGPSAGLTTLIPEAMRHGDFSALLAGPNPQQIYDPLATRPDPANPGGVVRDPFPGNQIPLNRIDPVAAALFANPLYPLPDLPDLVSNTRNTTRSLLENDQFDVKVDAKPTASDDLSARYSHGVQRTTAANSQPLIASSATRSPFHSVTLQWTRQLTPRIVNEGRAGFTRVAVVVDSGEQSDLGNLGEDLGIRDANRTAPGLPNLSATGAGNGKVVQQFTTNTFQYQDAVTWTHGRHLVKGGMSAIRYQQNVYFSGNSGQLGTIEFNGQYTRDLNDPRSIGSPQADFFLGYPSRASRGDFAGTWGHRSTLWAGFVQDDWRLADTVTLNLGLRYEYRTPFVEVHDRQVNLDLATGEPLYARKDGNSRALVEPYTHDWQPRLGVAWTPAVWGRHVVLRGAYGISSFLEGTGTNLRLTLNPPFFNEFEAINADPVALGPTTGEAFTALREKDPLAGTILRAWDPTHRPARSQQWNVTSQYEMPHQLAVSIGYVGQSGTGLVVPVNYDQRPSPGAPRPFDEVYPQIASVILTTPNARMRYDAMQVLAERRYERGWGLVTSYTWSHAMSNARGFFSTGAQAGDQAAYWPDPRNPDADWGPAPYDVRHNVTVAGLVDLPWGRDRRYLSEMPRWVDALVGGWSAAPIWRAHTGFAITIQAPDQSKTGARTGRPDRIGSGEGPQQVGPGRLWFDTSAFVLPKTGTFGNAGVGIIRGPGQNVVDLSLSKRVRVTPTQVLEFRAEAFNVFNHPVFLAPVRDLTSPVFGQVRGSQLEREIQLAVRFEF
jgi:Carboxypeptidase regulatory-like domain/TonB dependent receptor